MEIKEKFKPIIVDRVARRLAAASLFFNLTAWVLLLVRIAPLVNGKQLVDLHYNVYLKVNDIGPGIFAFTGAAIGTVIIVINFWLAARSYAASRQNTLVVLVVTAFYEFLVLVAAFFLILINLSH
jgi:hypothetical protein